MKSSITIQRTVFKIGDLLVKQSCRRHSNRITEVNDDRTNHKTNECLHCSIHVYLLRKRTMWSIAVECPLKYVKNGLKREEDKASPSLQSMAGHLIGWTFIISDYNSGLWVVLNESRVSNLKSDIHVTESLGELRMDFVRFNSVHPVFFVPNWNVERINLFTLIELSLLIFFLISDISDHFQSYFIQISIFQNYRIPRLGD